MLLSLKWAITTLQGLLSHSLGGCQPAAAHCAAMLTYLSSGGSTAGPDLARLHLQHLVLGCLLRVQGIQHCKITVLCGFHHGSLQGMFRAGMQS